MDARKRHLKFSLLIFVLVITILCVGMDVTRADGV
jgi:hypothetical protein